MLKKNLKKQKHMFVHKLKTNEMKLTLGRGVIECGGLTDACKKLTVVTPQYETHKVVKRI